MLAAFESLLPIFLLIGLGFLLRWRKIVAADMWRGVALVAIIMGVLVPVANIVNVAVVARNSGSRPLTYAQTTYVVFRNPFIWATAMSAYVLARQMGGHAQLIATTVTLQTLISLVTIPLVIILAKRLT